MRASSWIALALAALACAGPAPAQLAPPAAAPDVPSLSIDLQPQTLTIGDRLQATLRLEVGEELASSPRFPVWEGHWGEAEILTVDSPNNQGGGSWTQRLELAVFSTGPVTLPSVAVEVPAAGETTPVASPPVVIQVDSVLPATEEEVAPEPPAAPVGLPIGREFWWVLAVLGPVFLGLAFLALRSARRIRDALASLALSPMEAFERALARLRTEANVEQIYTGLSLELRRYLGRALGFPAAEGTTTQIQRFLRQKQLPAELVRETLALLREADQIKFARGEAGRDRADRRLDDAQRLAGGVEQWLEPAPVAASDPATEAVA